MQRLEVLAGDLAVRRDARAEDELRALVGEYDESAWRAKQEEHDAGISTLEAERAACEAEHARMRDLLAEATRGPRAPSDVEAPAVSADVAAESQGAVAAAAPPALVATTPAAPSAPTVESVPQGSGITRPSGLFAPQAPVAEQPPTTKRPSPFDEIGFLRTVVGRVTPFPATEPPPPPVEPPAALGANRPAAPRPDVRRPVERPMVPAFEAPPIPDVPAATPARASAPALPALADEPPPPPPSASTPRASGADAAGGAAAAADDAARSLKCQECGWMNYPTEWYCEKCGGELAAF